MKTYTKPETKAIELITEQVMNKVSGDISGATGIRRRNFIIDDDNDEEGF